MYKTVVLLLTACILSAIFLDIEAQGGRGIIDPFPPGGSYPPRPRPPGPGPYPPGPVGPYPPGPGPYPPRPYPPYPYCQCRIRCHFNEYHAGSCPGFLRRSRCCSRGRVGPYPPRRG